MRTLHDSVQTNNTPITVMAKANHHKVFEPTIANGPRRLARIRCCVFTKADNVTPDPDGFAEEFGNYSVMANATIVPLKGGLAVSYTGQKPVLTGVVMT